MAKKQEVQKETLEEKVQKLIYDPNKIYQWKTNDEFILTGIELQVLNEYLTNFVMSALDVPSILKVTAAKKIIQDKIAQYVESGKIIEAPEQAPQA